MNLLKIINLPVKKTLGPFTFTGDFNHFKKKITTVLHKCFKGIGKNKRKHFPTDPFYGISLSMISKPDKDIIRKITIQSHVYWM